MSVAKVVSIVPEATSILAESVKIIARWPRNNIVKACESCGLSPLGNKAKLAQTLASSALQLDHQLSARVISIDLGIKNFAQAVIDIGPGLGDSRRPQLKRWEKRAVEILPVHDPVLSTRFARRLAENVQQLAAPGDGGQTFYILERQTYRGSGLRMIPGGILNLCRLETQLHCFLWDQAVQSVDSRHVAKTFQLEPKGKAKKKAAIDKVQELIEAPAHKGLVELSEGLKEYFRTSEKKDDLADCLLQGLAFISWRMNLTKLKDRLISEIGNRV